MANRFDAQALCRGLYELTDGDLSASLDTTTVAERLALSQQELRTAADFATRKGWLTFDGTTLQLCEEGRRFAEKPRCQRFRVWGAEGARA